MKKHWIFTMFLCALFGQLAVAQGLDKEKLDQFFAALEANNKFMGSVAVSKDGKIIYTRTIGYADVEQQQKANENTRYRIGSLSKTFTAVLVLKAVEAGKLQLDQPIRQYFPTIANADKITIRHLLSHRSGIFNITDREDYLEWNTRPHTEKELIALMEQGGSVFAPGSKADYSNSNYMLLTFLLEKIYKKPYGQLLQEQIVQPLQLKNTVLGGRINPANNESRSYRFAGSWKLSSETDISIPLGAGGVVSTPSDIVQFSDALFGGRLLKSESLAVMKDLKDNFGSGLFVIPFYEHKSYGHTGGIDEFVSVFSHFPESNISFAITSNGWSINPNDVSIAVLSATFGKPYEVPQFTSYAVAAGDLAQYLGTYASPQLPIKLTITSEDGVLIAQATGQPAFPLEAVAEHKFQISQVSAVLEFNPGQKTLTLKQGGGSFVFTRE